MKWSIRKWLVVLAGLLLIGMSLGVFANHAPISYFSSSNYLQDTTKDRYPTAMAALQSGWYVTNYCPNGGYYDVLLGAEPDPNSPGNGYAVGALWTPYSKRLGCDGHLIASAQYNMDSYMEQWTACSATTVQSRYPGFPCTSPTGVDPDKSRGRVVSPNCACGDPIDPATGNAYLIKTEYRGVGPFPLEVAWTYNSSGVSATTSPTEQILGANRTLNYLRSVRVYSQSANNLVSAYLTRDDGKTYIADFANGVWTLDADVDGALTSTQDDNGNFTGFSYLNNLGQTEAYSSSGDLVSITDRNGFQQTLTRNSKNQITSAQDSLGRTLAFAYDSAGRLSQVTQPDGGLITFAYDSNNNLQKVTYPDNKSIQYNYGESAYTSGATLPHALTSIVDENGVTYDTTTYNNNGLATANALVGNVANYALSYQLSQSAVTTATITDPLGATSTVNFQPSLGLNRPLKQSSSCSNCVTLTDNYTFGSNGQVATHTDGRGNIASYAYDNAALLTQRIDAQSSSVQRTTAFTWNDTLRLPLTRTVSNASGDVVNNSQWVYNSIGQTLARCEIDPANSAAAGYACSNTGTVPAGVRRWTYSYCTAVDTTQCPIVGLTLTVTGPRTDITQTTAYSYYLTSSATNCGTPGAACHQAGDLRTVTDVSGHVTTVASYDADGRVTRLTDPNGVNTDLTYTPRGWLASRAVGGAQTTLGYTAYGAVQTVTDPDGTKTTYGYDAAHRLTKITDAQGNYVQYTLDAAGNKTAEQVYDSTGTLHKSLSRTFNTLGQLTKVMDGLSHTVFDASASGSYDANGNLIQSADGLGIQRQMGYDALNRLVQTLDNYNGTN
ncbi:DUF6531 domain-containing protein [Dyella acidisoli]|uniref:RHS repeat protein n=1 Tax=Dyella acidisoli TaxID=1867834 RepID=A0ABQ5XY03_9GAMM|nr:DUF6531 domain-containing protein [Dyella acidisoli]GLQ95248.1 hypothetical protein GCM10007901_42030 [Dyella acidisoli]